MRMYPYSNGSPQLYITFQKSNHHFAESRLLFWCLCFFVVCMILIIVTTIPTIPTIVSIINCTSQHIFHMHRLPKEEVSKCKHFGERRTAIRFEYIPWRNYNKSSLLRKYHLLKIFAWNLKKEDLLNQA